MTRKTHQTGQRPESAKRIEARIEALGERATPLIVCLLVLITLLRLAALDASHLQLHFDEAQYWLWSRELDFGYFSKPPLLALIIRAADVVCGSAEACVRAPAPILHAISAFFVFLAARRLHSTLAGLIAGLSFALMPAIAVSSFVISTDVPLLTAWSIALYAFIRHGERPSWGWALLIALMIALGLNAKYAMVYFPLSAALYLALSDSRRALLKQPATLLALTGGIIGLVPNLVWNVQHDFITFQHTGDNIEGRGLSLDPVDFAGFLASQFALAGPVMLIVVLAALFARLRSKKNQGTRKQDPMSETTRLLVSFYLPILAILTLQALLSRANPNWTATAFPALVIHASILLVTMKARWPLVLHGATIAALSLFAIVFAAIARPDDRLVRMTNLKHMVGWDIVAARIEAAASASGTRIVVIDNRKIIAGAVYYLRHSGLDIRAFHEAGAVPGNHFELTRPADVQSLTEPFLIVTQSVPARFAAFGERMHLAGEITLEETGNRRQVANILAIDAPVRQN